jgi:glycosyltransferase involved in cell wall biosynthesis
LLIENVPSDRIVVQSVGVDTQVFRPTGCDESLLREWAVPDGWTSVLYCGRLIREKGVLDLVRALVELPRTVLILVGEGSELPRIRVAAAACGVDDRIRYIGPVAYASMPRFYSTADVFCLPSVSTPYWQEQFGMVLVEAMACGIPVVTTATGSIPEVVGDAALIVPPYAPEQLATALGAVLDDPTQRAAASKAGLQRVVDHYDAAKVAASLRRIYDRLIC